jgi:hypothetical protein
MQSRTTRKFRRLFNDLPADVQRDAKRAYSLFQNNPTHPGLQFNKEGGRRGRHLLGSNRSRLPRSGSHDSCRESILEPLKNPDEAAHHPNACLEDDDARVFLLALRDVAEARGGIRSLSRDAREPLSNALEVRQSIA